MNKSDFLYGSWKISGTAFNKMLYCGSRYNERVVHALRYLPQDVYAHIADKLAIFSTAQIDACRIARVICKEREIIILSDRILPNKDAVEDQSEVRYFIFVIFHEIAHAYKKHRSPLFDQLTENEASTQEAEADQLAYSLFNKHVKERNNPYLLPLKKEEIEEAQKKNQELMNKLYDGV